MAVVTNQSRPAATVGRMDGAVITGAFTLGGVAVGGVLEWLLAAGARRASAAAERDELFAALCSACTRLMIEANTWRTLDTRRAKLKQHWFGLVESEVHGPSALASSGSAAATFRGLAGAAATGLRHLSPIALSEGIRSNLMPMLSDVLVLTAPVHDRRR